MPQEHLVLVDLVFEVWHLVLPVHVQVEPDAHVLVGLVLLECSNWVIHTQVRGDHEVGQQACMHMGVGRFTGIYLQSCPITKLYHLVETVGDTLGTTDKCNVIAVGSNREGGAVIEGIAIVRLIHMVKQQVDANDKEQGTVSPCCTPQRIGNALLLVPLMLMCTVQLW